MEAKFILQIQIPWNPNRRVSPSPLSSPRFIRASSSSSQEPRSYRVPKPSKNLVADFISKNDDSVRSLPIYVGGASLLAVLFNRAVSGIAPVADASSSQSRADLLALGLAVTNLLTGLVWLSIRPKSITPVSFLILLLLASIAKLYIEVVDDFRINFIFPLEFYDFKSVFLKFWSLSTYPILYLFDMNFQPVA